MVEVTAIYQGGLRVLATHGPSGARLETDAPLDNRGRGEAFSPTDLVGTALGACCLTILGIQAEDRDLNLEGASVRVEKHMIREPVRRIGRLMIDFTVPVAVDPENRQGIEAAIRRCPVVASLHPDIELNLRFHWAD